MRASERARNPAFVSVSMPSVSMLARPHSIRMTKLQVKAASMTKTRGKLEVT